MLISAAKANEAADVLGVELTGLTPAVLATAYRGKAKECHPDYHGSDKLQLWSRISWANECLKHWLKSSVNTVAQAVGNPVGNCRACSGSGRVQIKRTSGFGAPMTMMCIMCKGAGAISEEREPNGGE